MKQFKPFDKVLYRYGPKGNWIPDIYSFYEYEDKEHFVIGNEDAINDEDIISYEGNEYLVGTRNEPEKNIIIEKDELIVCSDSLLELLDGIGSIQRFRGLSEDHLHSRVHYYTYCIPMSKYNPDNLEETKKWILRVINGKLVKVNK